MRVDKWIWAVRMVKSRTLAKEFCDRGKVWINGQKAKPAKNLALGDTVEVDKEVFLRYRVTGFIPKRVSAELAAQNYEDLSPKSDTIIASDRPVSAPRRAKGEGRPTKKDYRALKKFQEFEEE